MSSHNKKILKVSCQRFGKSLILKDINNYHVCARLYAMHLHT